MPPTAVSRRPSPARRPSRTKRRLLAVTSLGLAGFLAGLLSGCSTGTAATGLPSPVTGYAQLAGNWQFSSSSAPAARLASLGGSLTLSSGSTVSAILHPLSRSGQCLDTSTAITVTGSLDTQSHLTLSGPVAGGVLSLSGTLAPDGRSLSNPAYTVTGGDCGFPPAAQTSLTPRDSTSPVIAQQYQPVTGNYAGTLTTSEGQTFSLSSDLTQTSQPDANGVYHITGTAAAPGNSCIPASLPATASNLDGGSISATYTDPVTGASITATGNTSPDGTTITISSWTINSPCGTDTGSGTLTRQ